MIAKLIEDLMLNGNDNFVKVSVYFTAFDNAEIIGNGFLY